MRTLTPTRIAILAIVAGLLWSATLGYCAHSAGAQSPINAIEPAPLTYVCGVEDDPDWDWVMCGNGVRGIGAVRGARLVGPCEYAYRVRHHIMPRGTRSAGAGDRTAMHCRARTLHAARKADRARA